MSAVKVEQRVGPELQPPGSGLLSADKQAFTRTKVAVELCTAYEMVPGPPKAGGTEMAPVTHALLVGIELKEYASPAQVQGEEVKGVQTPSLQVLVDGVLYTFQSNEVAETPEERDTKPQN